MLFIMTDLEQKSNPNMFISKANWQTEQKKLGSLAESSNDPQKHTYMEEKQQF